MLKIGDFSKLSQVSVKALRFYDEIGLLKPTYVDRITGYRYYSMNLLSRLNRILVFKELGFSLDEIALLMQEDLPTDRVREALQRKRAELSCRITKEQARMVQVETWLTQIERENSIPDYEIGLKQVPSQLVASMRAQIASYEETTELFAEINHHLKKYDATGQYGALWHACASEGRQIDCEAFIFLNDLVPANKRVRVYELPASTNACITHQGGDETITQAYVIVRAWIKAHGYVIAGPNRELYWQSGIALNDNLGVTEIQYPIFKEHTVASIDN